MSQIQDLQQQMMVQLGLDTLSPEKQTEMLERMTEIFLKKLYVETAERLGEAEMHAYEAFAETHTPEEAATWLVDRLPDYETWVEKLREEFIAEMRKGMMSKE